MKNILNKIIHLVHEAVIVDSSIVKFTSDVRKACEQNLCGLYGKRWTCPPAVGTLEECKNRCLKYNKALVFTTYDVIEDSFDFEGMLRVRAQHDDIQQKVIDKIKDDLSSYILLGAGGCTKCKNCSYPKPCRYNKMVIPSVESYGIDVVTLSNDTNMNYTNGENTVTYFSIIFFNN